MRETAWEKLADFAIGIVNPTRKVLRKHWRRVARDPEYRESYELGLRLRGYKSAQTGTNDTPWMNASARSADGEILGDLPSLRNRSRALNRDDAIAAGITGTMVRGVIGTGLRPQARTGSDAKDDALEAVWKQRCDHLAPADGCLPHGQQQRLRYAKRLEDGEYLLRPAISAPGEPLWIETIEAERLATPADAKPVDSKGRIVDGVEKDRFGRVVAYWVMKRHPGETLSGLNVKLGAEADGRSPWTKQEFDRVPHEFAYHGRSKVTRPGQTRGVPLCHPILQDLRDLDLLILATLKRTQVAACLAAFLTSDAAATDLIELTAQDYGYQLDQKLEPGMIFRLFPGESVQFLNPAGGLPELEKFIFFLARRVGTAIGLSPQAVLRAWEGVSYSGARTIKIDDRQTFRTERADFAHSLCWEWRIVLEDELLRGNPLLLAAGVTMDDLIHVEWIGDEEQWVDPQAEAQATELMLAMGLTTLQIECARLGRDWQENIRQKLAAELLEKELREEMDLVAPEPKAVPKPKVLPKEEAA